MDRASSSGRGGSGSIVILFTMITGYIALTWVRGNFMPLPAVR